MGGDKSEKVKGIGSSSRSGNGSGEGDRLALDDLMREEEKVNERMNSKDYWLCKGIIVKVISKALEKKGYYKKKGVVRKVIGKYVGEIKMLDGKHVLRVYQEELKIVIPQIGGMVRIVNGAYHRSNARLLLIDTYNYCAKVLGVFNGRVLLAIKYEDIC
ncbi:DNA/RNA-binding protein kin17 [Ancistrocladus abbreviatus]